MFSRVKREKKFIISRPGSVSSQCQIFMCPKITEYLNLTMLDILISHTRSTFPLFLPM